MAFQPPPLPVRFWLFTISASKHIYCTLHVEHVEHVVMCRNQDFTFSLNPS